MGRLIKAADGTLFFQEINKYFVYRFRIFVMGKMPAPFIS